MLEKRIKFRYLIKNATTKNEVKRELSSCVEERFNRFQVVKNLFGKEEKRKFIPLDIVYKPIKSLDQKIECYFTDEIRLAYRALVHKGKLRFDFMTAEQCYACNAFVARKSALDKHLETCSFMPGIVYKFENQHITTFEDNFRFMGDLHFSFYFDLGTTCGKKEFYNVEKSDDNMYPISYCFIVAFHPLLELEKITVLRSFNDSLEQLNDISYLSEEMIRYFDPITVKQLQNCAEDVFNKKNYFSLIEMFNCELKFVIDVCKKWMDEKFMRKNAALKMHSKQKYKKKNHVDFSSTKCATCNFNLGLATTKGTFVQDNMTYFAFVVQKEHHFLRNILDPDELKVLKNMKNIESYFSAFKKFIKIFSVLDISQINARNIRTFKQTKLEQIKMISFVYERIMNFPGRSFNHKTLVSRNFFDSVLNLTLGDVVLHHSHIDG